MFKKGAYIVLETGPENESFKHGYVYKQLKDHVDIFVEKDLTGKPNGWSMYPSSPDKRFNEGTWRKATELEISMYDFAGKPVIEGLTVIDYLKATNQTVFELPRL